MAILDKIDSNISGLRYAEETSLGVLPAAAAQFWFPLEPNSYGEWGGNITTIARNPINPSRQRKKGVVVDEDAGGSFTTDLTQVNVRDIMQGFFYADLREKTLFQGTVTAAITPDQYTGTGIHTGFFAGDLILVTGFATAANNGLKRVTAVGTGELDVAETLVAEATVAGVRVRAVGFQFDSGDLEVVVPGGGNLPYLERTGGTKDLTQLGLIPGEFIYVGGDAANTSFATAANNGLMRVRSVSATRIAIDKSVGALATDDGAGRTIQLFKAASVLKNEVGTDIKRRSYTLERTLGANDDSDLTLEQAEYLHGAIGSEFVFNVNTADKLTLDLTFAALRSSVIDENDSGADTLLSKAAVDAGSAANAPPLVEADAFNTSSNIPRINLSVYTPGNPAPSPLFAFVQELTLNLNNNITPNKAIGVLGAFEMTAGTLEVGGNITAYFSEVSAVAAVKDNEDVTLDMHFFREQAGISLDLPLLTLSDGRPNVEQDQAIMIPLEEMAATGAKIDPGLDHTIMMMFWDYLPAVAV